MVDWSTRVQEFVDGIGASVAVIGRNEDGQFIVPACNDGFFQMTGGRSPGVRAATTSATKCCALSRK